MSARAGRLLADHLGSEIGAPARWVFLIGAWATVTSSLLGVWQAVPYLFADYWRLVRGGERSEQVDLKKTRAYRVFQVCIAVGPIAGMAVSFRQAQLFYVITGAAFLPALAAVLLVMNGRSAWVGQSGEQERGGRGDRAGGDPGVFPSDGGDRYPRSVVRMV